jgi:hypothetical protein
LDQVDFSGAIFRQVDFLGFDLEGITLPEDSDLRLLRRARCSATRGLEILDGDDRIPARQLRAMLQVRLRGPGTDNEARVLNRRDYLEIGGVDLADLAENVLISAERDCLKE